MKNDRNIKWIIGNIGPVYAVLIAVSTVPAQYTERAPSLPSSAPDVNEEHQARWKYFAPVVPPKVAEEQAKPALVELILGPAVFSHARPDLADLRLFDASGRTMPYALRFLRPISVRDRVPTQEFNRSEPKEGPLELSLDLHAADIQHNEVQIVTSGLDFRRHVVIEASGDSTTWRPLEKGFLVRYARDDQKIDLQSITYPPSRTRYLRIRISPDEGQPKDEFKLQELNVLRRIEVPGEEATFAGQLGPREPVRTTTGPGSAWIIELGGDNVPCDRLEVEVADTEFARDVSLQVELPGGPDGRRAFTNVFLTSDNVWRRTVGHSSTPMLVKFGEVQTSRLKLIVTDYRNAPLEIRSVRFGAPARQVVFARPTSAQGEPRLYFGNPLAEATNYDFARNLPERLDPAPTRTSLGELQQNPHFVPPPKPFTERFPWLIYVVLGSVTAFLTGIIVSLARATIVVHDSSPSTV